MNSLESIWSTLTNKYCGNDKLKHEVWSELKDAYTQGGRHYHNLSHLEYMMGLIQHYQHDIEDLDTMRFTVFYHDVIYNTSRDDNELRSAELAVERLGSLAFPDAQIARCKEQILATKDHSLSNDNDVQYLVDIDLAILGDTRAAYENYTQNIRKEYSIYPFFLYKQGRKKVLEHFLKMPRIYKTQAFFTAREQKARENLEWEMTQLT